MERSGRKGGSRPPVSAHPAFPAIVALWFAALLGLGSLIMPVALVERVVGATGLAAVFPAAAPPLGFTARAAIALVATLGGAMLGLWAARRVAAPRDAAPVRDQRKTSRRLLDAQDDLDEDDAIDVPAFLEPRPAGTRRRALAIEEESGPSDFLTVAPLPGADDFAEEAAIEGTSFPDMAAEADDLEEGEETLDLGESEEFLEFDPAPAVIEQPAPFAAPAPMPFARPAPAPSRPLPEPLPFSPPSMARRGEDEAAAPRPFDAPAPEPVAAPLAEATAPFEHFEADQSASEDLVADKQTFDSYAFEAEAPFDDEPDQVFAPDAPVAADSEATEGLGDLLNRLGQTIEKHREWSAARADHAAAMPTPAPTAVPTAAAPVPREFEPAEADEAAEAMAAYFQRPSAQQAQEAQVAAMPTPASPTDDLAPAATLDFSAPRPVIATPSPSASYAPFAGLTPLPAASDEDEEEDEVADLAASFSLPLNAAASASPPRPSLAIAPADRGPQASMPDWSDDAEQETTSSGDAAYGSLSAIENPFKSKGEEFVRIEEPDFDIGADAVQPAVLFPNEQVRQHSLQAPAGTFGRAFDPPADAPEAAAPRAASNDDNERALREALLNLQRMSK